MWIWGEGWKDAAWLYVPGLIAVALAFSHVFEANSTGFLIFAFVAGGLLDSGHVYTTLWRTYFHRDERRRSHMYVVTPVLVFAIFALWLSCGGLWIGTFIVYATLFHNVRQFFGISKWYQRLNGVMRPASDKFLYALSFGPAVIGHFRSDVVWPSYYTRDEVMIVPWPEVYGALMSGYLAVLAAWVAYEIWILRKSREWNRTLAIAMPALVYGLSFLRGQSLAEILFPLVVAHGAAYIGLTALSTHRLGRPVKWPLGAMSLVVLFTALVFGTMEVFFEEFQMNLLDPRVAPLMALYLTPLFCHFIFDAFLWKASHPEASQIYTPNLKAIVRT